MVPMKSDEPTGDGKGINREAGAGALLAFAVTIFFAVLAHNRGRGEDSVIPFLYFLWYGLPAYGIGVICAVVALWNTAKTSGDRFWMLSITLGVGAIGVGVLWSLVSKPV